MRLTVPAALQTLVERGGGFEMNRPRTRLASTNWGFRLSELVRRLWRKMPSPAAIESNPRCPLNSPKQKQRQNPRDFGPSAPKKYGARNLAGGATGIRTLGTVGTMAERTKVAGSARLRSELSGDKHRLGIGYLVAKPGCRDCPRCRHSTMPAQKNPPFEKPF